MSFVNIDKLLLCTHCPQYIQPTAKIVNSYHQEQNLKAKVFKQNAFVLFYVMHTKLSNYDKLSIDSWSR